ncbi:MAG: 30S ribosomal protein S12 methylthiotransferase RimO [Candidatus Nanopelagicaceae bacterium]|nr:30S ribosomal protein S12 methylthiotransferase RimO [Candidatus Nanopelagicaceae bacterium]
MPKTVALITMGCARNDVDSEELAGRLAADGWKLVDDAANAEVAVINTCGFIESAKQDSINTLLEAHALKGNGTTKAVVAVGCMAERYGEELAAALPEADGILSFDDYKDISTRLGDILSGHKPTPHVPQDRRKLLPIAPADRARTSDFARQRLNNDPWAPLKIASGCDRRCAFCAIPQFRGAFVSRHPLEVIAEAKWLADNGVSEIFLVSENTTSYGKDLGDLRAMEKLLPELSKIDGIKRIRLSYLQPAEMRPTLLQAMIEHEKVAPYFDLSFQHTAKDVLRAMRRFGGSSEFLHLISQIRALSPEAGIRSNFIVGFPGESERDFEDLCKFIDDAKLDAVGVFGYSDEDGTEALNMQNKIDPEVIAERVATLSTIADNAVSERATLRIGSEVEVLIDDPELQEGRAAFQGPEVDGTVGFVDTEFRLGQWVKAVITESAGADLIAKPL